MIRKLKNKVFSDNTIIVKFQFRTFKKHTFLQNKVSVTVSHFMLYFYMYKFYYLMYLIYLTKCIYYLLCIFISNGLQQV